MIRDRKSFEARYPGSDYNVEVWVDDFLKRRWTDNSDPHYGAAQDILTDSRMWWYPPLPDRNYQNPCALDFGPESAGREPLDLLRSHRNRHYWMKEAERIREDVQTWKKLLQERWGYFSRERPQAARIWSSLDAVTRWYLLMRASDLALYDERLANITFPKPSNSDYAWVVSSLVWLFTEYKNELAKKADDEEEADERRLVEKSCAEEVGKISVAPPAQLKPRTLSAREIHVVRNTCIEELKAADKQTRGVAATIDEFARFCELLSKPENHIKVRTGQLVERHVQTRQEADMVNEVARVLTSLPKYTAYAKIVAEKGGVPQIWKRKIKTARLVAAREDEAAETRRSVVKHMVDYCRPRGHIQEEIARRQKTWGVHAPDAPLASAKRPPVPARFGAQSPQPPPTRTRGRLPRDR